MVSGVKGSTSIIDIKETAAGVPVIKIAFNSQLTDLITKALPIIALVFAGYQSPTYAAVGGGTGFVLGSLLVNYRTQIDDLWADLSIPSQTAVTIITAIITIFAPYLTAWLLAQHFGGRLWDTAFPPAATKAVK